MLEAPGGAVQPIGRYRQRCACAANHAPRLDSATFPRLEPQARPVKTARSAGREFHGPGHPGARPRSVRLRDKAGPPAEAAPPVDQHYGIPSRRTIQKTLKTCRHNSPKTRAALAAAGTWAGSSGWSCAETARARDHFRCGAGSVQ